MKQVIDNLSDFVTHVAIEYSKGAFEEIVILRPDHDADNDNDARPSADVVQFPRTSHR